MKTSVKFFCFPVLQKYNNEKRWVNSECAFSHDIRTYQPEQKYHFCATKLFLTHCSPIFYFYTLENVRTPLVFRGYRNGTLC